MRYLRWTARQGGLVSEKRWLGEDGREVAMALVYGSSIRKGWAWSVSWIVGGYWQKCAEGVAGSREVARADAETARRQIAAAS